MKEEAAEKEPIRKQVIFLLYRDELEYETQAYKDVLEKKSPSGTIVSLIKYSRIIPSIPSIPITVESCSIPFKEELDRFSGSPPSQIEVHLLQRKILTFTSDGSYGKTVHDFLSPSDPKQFIHHIWGEEKTIEANRPHIVFMRTQHISLKDTIYALNDLGKQDGYIVEYDQDLFYLRSNQKSGILLSVTSSKDEHEESAKNSLMQIRADIFEKCKGETKTWKTFFGDKIEIEEIGTNKKISARVPTGVKLMLKEIEEARTSDLGWERALENVHKIASDRLDYKPGCFSFFYKRDESTTDFYTQVVSKKFSLADERIEPILSN
jgi:hypothetical protein